jgi:purine catabolism regulator
VGDGWPAGWPRGEHEELRQIAALSERGLAAIGIAVPGYLERFSPAARAEAERCDLPLIEIPWDIPFAQITEELHRSLLLAQREEIERSEAIHRALTRVAVDGSSLSDLARRLSELIGRSVTIENQDGKVLAFFDTDGDGDDARRETIAATQSPSSLISALDRLGHIDRIRTASAPVRIPEIPELGMSARVACPIRIGRDLAGYVWILEGDAPLGELDHRAAEHAALVAALQIAHQRELALVESRLGYASFLSLLEAPGATSALALERAQLLGFDPQIAHRVGIVALDEPLPIGREGVLRREKVIERLRRQLSLAGVSQPMLGALYNLIPTRSSPRSLARTSASSSGARTPERTARSAATAKHARCSTTSARHASRATKTCSFRACSSATRERARRSWAICSRRSVPARAVRHSGRRSSPTPTRRSTLGAPRGGCTSIRTRFAIDSIARQN